MLIIKLNICIDFLGHWWGHFCHTVPKVFGLNLTNLEKDNFEKSAFESFKLFFCRSWTLSFGLQHSFSVIWSSTVSICQTFTMVLPWPERSTTSMADFTDLLGVWLLAGLSLLAAEVTEVNQHSCPIRHTRWIWCQKQKKCHWRGRPHQIWRPELASVTPLLPSMSMLVLAISISTIWCFS